MKFRAIVEDTRTLLGVLQVCRSIQKDCIVRLQATRTRFFTNTEASEGVQVWVGCRTDRLFRNFRCASSYAEQSITCELLDTAQLLHIVRYADARDRQSVRVYTLTLRLARVGAQPVLRASMHGTVDGQPDLSYDVPVRVLGEDDIARMRAPPLEDDRVQVVVPHVTELSTFMEKLRATSCDRVTFAAHAHTSTTMAAAEDEAVGDEGSSSSRHCGACATTTASDAHVGDKHTREGVTSHNDGRAATASLVICAEHTYAQFALTYHSVELVPQAPQRNNNNKRSDDDDEEGEEDSNATRHTAAVAATVTVDVRKFARFFAAVREVTPSRVSIYLVHLRALVLSVYAANGTTMVAYIPAKM